MDRRSVAKMLQETRITPIKVDLRKTIQNMELAQNLAYVQLQLMNATKKNASKCLYFSPIFSTLLTHYTHTYTHA